MAKAYLCIDLKTFFASVECKERNKDPFKHHLVVADPSRGNGALCLAITPSLKKLGIRNRCRIFEIPKHIKYEIAKPRMKLYMQYAADVYSVYLKYIAKEDIHVYSIDEAFLDITCYIHLYQKTPEEIARMIVDDIYNTTGITATAGIGSNLYLAKIALDITAKHVKDNIGILTVDSYKATLWHHQPLTDFWQVGRGIVKRLAKLGLYDMYDVAHCNPQILYKEFGINAQYLIDHANGIEPTTIADIKRYTPKSNSMSNGQILFEDYNYNDARLIVKEMVELNILRLVEEHLVTNHISLYVGYSKDVIKATAVSSKIASFTNSYQTLKEAFLNLYDHRVNKNYPIRRINISFGNLKPEEYETFDLFTDYRTLQEEKNLQSAIIAIKHKYGKNAVLKGMNLEEKGTTRQRNQLVGGHNAQ